MQTQTSAVRKLTDTDTGTQAAIRIQRAWRRRLSARTHPLPMDPDSRWKDAAIEARMKVLRWTCTCYIKSLVNGIDRLIG